MRNTLRAMGYHGRFLGQKALGQTNCAEELAQGVFEAKSLIFCLTNGRTGTRSLTSLFDCVPHVHAAHEEKPSFHLLMRWVQRNPALARDFWLFAKIPAISDHPQPVHVDTSHVFGKGFLEPLLDLGARPKLIILTRNTRLIAKSMLALNDIPGRTKRALKWYLSPSDPVFHRLPEPDSFSDYQLCYWHALETEARQAHYRRLCQSHGLTCVDADTATLNNLDCFERLCANLGIELDEQARENLKSHVGRTLNSRTNEKKQRPILLPSNFDEAEEEVRQNIKTEQPLMMRKSTSGSYLATALKNL